MRTAKWFSLSDSSFYSQDKLAGGSCSTTKFLLHILQGLQVAMTKKLVNKLCIVVYTFKLEFHPLWLEVMVIWCELYAVEKYILRLSVCYVLDNTSTGDFFFFWLRI